MDTLRNIRNNPSIALFLRIWFKLAALTLGVGTLLRIVLLFNPQTVDTGFSAAGCRYSCWEHSTTCAS